MKKIVLIILIALFITKINAQCTIPVATVVETFTGTTLPICWSYGGGNPGNIVANELVLASGSSISTIAILPKTYNARGIITFDARRSTGTSVASPVQVCVVSASGGQFSYIPIQTVNTTYVMTTYSVNLSSYLGTFQYIGFLSQGPSLVSGNNAAFIIDNVNYVGACQSTTVAAIAQNYTVQLNAFGSATLTPNQINNGSSSECGALLLNLSKTSFNCSNIGVNTITLTATDNSGNIASTTASVTILSAINNEIISVLQSTICSGMSTAITTGSSVSGIKYYLRDDATNTIITGPKIGNGSSLSFSTGSLTTNTTYNVYAETPVNYGLNFDGLNDMITTTLTTSATNSLTIEAWIFPRSVNNDKIVSNYFGSSASGEFLLDTYNATTNNGRALRLYVEGPGNVAHVIGAINVLTLNTWNHVAGTFSNGVTKIYVNGIAVVTGTAPFTSIPSCSNIICIGEDPVIGATEYFNGKMDEVRIWNTARTGAEILGNMNNCLVGNEAGLTTYFKFSENEGNTVTDLVTNSVSSMSGMDPNTAWVTGNVDCGSSMCNFEMANLITINVVANPIITVNSGTICAGNSFTIMPNGANTYTIQVGSAIKTPTSNASYTVVGTSSLGCVSNTFATSSITVSALPTINATTSNTLLCVGQTASLTADGTSTSYTWNTSSTNTVIVISPTVTTAYTVTGTDDNGCKNTSVITQNVSTCTDITQLSAQNNELTIFPNPVLNDLTIHFGAKIEKITIYNLLGEIVQSEVNPSFSVANLNAGVYLIEVISSHGPIIKRFMKE